MTLRNGVSTLATEGGGRTGAETTVGTLFSTMAGEGTFGSDGLATVSLTIVTILFGLGDGCVAGIFMAS